MRLFYSTGSPYARMVRIALLETGLDSRVTKQEVTRARLYSPDSEILAFNPLGRVPTLVLGNGTVITESKLILDFIDVLSPAQKLLPRDGSDGWRTFVEMGQALGLLEGIVTWVRALRLPQPESVSSVITRETIRVNRAADALEEAVANGAYAGSINAAQIALGVALGLIEPRLPVWKWREKRSALSAWYDAIALRPSFQSTGPSAL